MKKTILLLILITITNLVFSQVRDLAMYNRYITEGDELVEVENFFDAYEKYRKAEYWAGSDQNRKNIASDKMDYCIAKIKYQQVVSDSLLNTANLALKKAELMQLKVETAMFDKAVKEQNKDWKGYLNMCYNGELNDIGKEILDKIDSLDLSNNALLRLPKEVAECPNLKHINLIGNNDIDWQDCFAKAKTTGINSVYVSVNDLSDIDSNYWHLVTGIEILKNELQQIPTNILKQKQLTYLDLSGEYNHKNNFSGLPKELFSLINLKYLNLVYCQIDSLPPEIGNLTNLTTLGLIVNELTTLPPEIGNLTNLTELGLGSNNLTTLPPEIGNFTNLTELYLWRNELTTLPPEIGNLTNLTKLNLGENELTTLPPKIGNLTNLTKLSLSSNNLTTLPTEIGNLTNLTELNLWRNNLTILPPEIGNLTNLTELGLGSNNLTTLPPEIGNLTNLTKLDLSYNELSSLLTEIFSLDILSAGTWFEFGQQLFGAKNYEQALQAYLKSIEIDSTQNNKYAFGNAGLCYRLLGSYDSSLIYLNKRLEFDENNIWTLNQISATYLSMNDYSQAVEIKNKIISLEPDNYSNYNGLSWYSLFTGEYQQAIDAAKKSLDLAPEQTSVNTNLALAYVLNNQYELAEPIYLEWKDKNFPNDTRKCKEVFLKDIADLEATGITHPDFQKVKDLLE